MISFITSLLQLQLVYLLVVAGNPGVTKNSARVARELTTTQPAVILPEGYVNFHEHNVAYKIHKGLFVTWWEAQAICKSGGGNLAIIDSREKFKCVRKLLNRLGYSHRPWLAVGIYKSNVTNQWVRVDNDRPVMSAPGIMGKAKNDSGNCVFLSLRTDGLWDFFCHHKAEHFLCEILPTNDGEFDIRDRETNWVTTPFSISTEGYTVFPDNVTYATTEWQSIREVTTSTAPRFSELPEGYVVYSAEDHAAYKVHRFLSTWKEARDVCISEGADLPVADSYKKIARLLELANQDTEWGWIPVGIYKSTATDEWVGVDNDRPVLSMPWGPDGPAGDGRCAFLWNYNARGMGNVNCDRIISSWSVVCRIAINENNTEEKSTEKVAVTEEIQTADPASTMSNDNLTFTYGTAEWRTIEVEVQTSTTPRSSKLPEGYVVYSEDHAAYKVHVQNLDWHEARNKCIAEGAHLLITDSHKKIARLHELLSDLSDHNWVPVGIYKSAATNEWVRVDNDLPVTSMLWGQGEPTGVGNCAYWRHNGEYSPLGDLAYWWHNGKYSRLGDLDCGWSWDSFFVCEILITEDSSEKGSTEEGWDFTTVPETSAYTTAVTKIFETTTEDDLYLTEEKSIAEVEVQASTTPRSSKLPEGYVVYLEDHAAYKVHMQNLNWYEARNICIADGGHLPITDSYKKLARLHELVSHLEHGRWVPVGIYKSAATNKWVRVDNDLPVTSVPWGWEQPTSRGNCAYGRHDYRLKNIGCSWTWAPFFVCEIPLTEDRNETGSSEVTEEIQATYQQNSTSDDDETATYGIPEWYTAEVPVSDEVSITDSETSAYTTSAYAEDFETTTEDWYLTEEESTTEDSLFEGYKMAKYDYNVTYKFHRNYVSWNEARAICKSEGADLAVPDGALQKGEFIRYANEWDAEWPHVGVRRSGRRGSWIRTDTGRYFPSWAWSHVGPRSRNGYNCVGMSRRREDFIIYSCDLYKKPFICAKWI